MGENENVKLEGVNPLVSVVIPCYNAENYIEESVQSVLNQDFKNFELIIVDDGSGENTRKILKSLAEKDSRIKLVFHDCNKGIACSRNSGVSLSVGEYLSFLGADDVWKPNYLSTMVGEVQKTPDSILFCPYENIDADGRFLWTFQPPLLENPESLALACVQWAKRDDMFVNYSTIFAKTRYFKETPFWEELRMGEDLCNLLELVLVKKIPLRLVNTPLVRYRRHELQTTALKLAQIKSNNDKTRARINELLNKKIFPVKT